MLFNVLIILLIGVVVYFHYLQGFFSAALSALVAVLAATLAVGCHEWVIAALLRGRFADQAHALTLVGVFVAAYLILRTLFDSLVPGNVRFHVIVDKAGSIAMGLIAGTFAAGILAIAAQALPLGQSIAMYQRYPSESVTVGLRLGRGQEQYDLEVLNAQKFLADEPETLWVPADEIVLATAAMVSGEKGSLSTGRPLTSVHPSYLQELFGQRTGIQSAARRTMLENQVSLKTVYTVRSLPQVDAEGARSKETDQYGVGVRYRKEKNLASKPVFETSRGETLLVVRVVFDINASDKDNRVRFSPASVRLVAGGKNHFPIGTVERGTLWRNAPDDFLLALADRGADFAFVLPEDQVLSKDRVKDGVFVEIKRLARIDLSERAVERGIPPVPMVQEGDRRVPQIALLRKEGEYGLPPQVSRSSPPDRGPADATPPPPPAEGGPVVFQQVLLSAHLPKPINVGTPAEDGLVSQLGVEAVLQEGKFATIKVTAEQPIQRLTMGQHKVGELLAPTGQRVVQILCRADPNQPWQWASRLGSFQLVAGGKAYPPSGAWAQVDRANQSFLVMAYASSPGEASVEQVEGEVSDLALLFLVPAGSQLEAFNFDGRPLARLNQRVP